MVCIFCNNQTEVINSRPKARTPSVWRRRKCLLCAKQFTTTELPAYDNSLLVIGPGKNKPFSRDKLFLSLNKSLGHRADALDAATALTATVIGKILKPKHEDGLLSPYEIANTSFNTLKRFDPLAAASYKAYHQATLKSKKITS